MSTWRLHSFSCNICIFRRVLTTLDPIFLILMMGDKRNGRQRFQWVGWMNLDDHRCGVRYDMGYLFDTRYWTIVEARWVQGSEVQVKEVGRSCAACDRAINLWSDDPIVWFTNSYQVTSWPTSSRKLVAISARVQITSAAFDLTVSPCQQEESQLRWGWKSPPPMMDSWQISRCITWLMPGARRG